MKINIIEHDMVKIQQTLCTWRDGGAEDMGEFYRIPADNRNLNYAYSIFRRENKMFQIEDYHSHNTNKQVEGNRKILAKLP
jgi:UDP-glucose 4-epimerase